MRFACKSLHSYQVDVRYFNSTLLDWYIMKSN